VAYSDMGFENSLYFFFSIHKILNVEEREWR